MFENEWGCTFDSYESAFEDAKQRIDKEDYKRYISAVLPIDEAVDLLFTDFFTREIRLNELKREALQEFFKIYYWGVS